MSYIAEIFERADIQQIREFLLNGVELPEISPKSYVQRLSDDMDKALSMLRMYFPKNYDAMEQSLVLANQAYQDVYMEIGLQVGFRLVMQGWQSTKECEK